MRTTEYIVQSFFRGKWRDFSSPAETIAQGKRDLADEIEWCKGSKTRTKHRLQKVVTVETRTTLTPRPTKQ
jgi:hypothetical protein